MSLFQKRFLLYLVLGLYAAYMSVLLIILDYRIPVLSLIPDLAQLGVYCALFIILLFVFINIMFVKKLKINKNFFTYLAIIFLLFACFNIIFSNFYFLKDAKREALNKSFMFVSSNIHVENIQIDKSVDFVLKNKADIVSFIEVSKNQSEKLTNLLKEDYPYTKISLTQGIFGMAIYSRTPFIESEFVNDDGTGEPYFKGKVILKGIEINLNVIHPMPPFTHESLLNRDRIIESLAASLNNEQVSIIMGDFNATKISSAFRNLSKLNRNYLIAPTSSYFSIKPFYLLIDHILFIGNSIKLHDSGHKDVEGSDHRLVWASFGKVNN